MLRCHLSPAGLKGFFFLSLPACPVSGPVALTPAVSPSQSATGGAARGVFVQPSHFDVPVPSVLSLPSCGYFSELLNE